MKVGRGVDQQLRRRWGLAVVAGTQRDRCGKMPARAVAPDSDARRVCAELVGAVDDIEVGGIGIVYRCGESEFG